MCFFGIAGGLREGSEDIDGVARGFVGVAPGVFDGIASGVFDGIASGFMGITGGLDGMTGGLERGVGQVSGESGSLVLGLELLGFSCSDSRLTPTG